MEKGSRLATRVTARKSHGAGRVLAVVAVLIVALAVSFVVLLLPNLGTSSTMAFGSDDEFGLGRTKVATTTSVAVLADDAEPSDLESASSALTAAASRDITSNIDSINAYLEEERRKAEEALRIEEAETLKAVEQKMDEQRATAGIPAGLDNIDWSVGKKAFIEEWTKRIDEYMAGYPLAGYGEVFATAAWNNRIDPRLSPAISRTESTSGQVCFKPYNAWGWGTTTWYSWEQAINDHVSGMAEAYGYTLSWNFAMQYCPPTYQHWYRSTYAEMLEI